MRPVAIETPGAAREAQQSPLGNGSGGLRLVGNQGMNDFFVPA